MKKGMANRDRIALTTMATVAVVAIAVAVFLWSSGETRAQFGGLSGSITPVESKIGYQGQLTDSVGQLLTGTYGMKFRLYNADVGGSQVGSEIDKGTVAVSQGLFSVELPVDASHFDGQALWLEVQVGTEVLSPRQEILPVPYALHTMSPPGPCQKFEVPQLTPAEIIGLEEAGQLPVYHVVDVPDFCIDGICQIWVRYHDENAMGALATPGVLGAVYYIQDSSDGSWIGGPNLAIAGLRYSGGSGINGDSEPEGVLYGGRTVEGGYVYLLDDGAESSPDQWTVEFYPVVGASDNLTQVSYYFCPCARDPDH